MFKKLQILLLLCVLAFTAKAQTYKEIGGTGQVLNGLFARELLLPDDTVLTKAKNVDTCQQIAKKNGVLYSYNCSTHKWETLASKGAVTANNIQDLRTTAEYTNVSNKVIYLAGYYEPGDGGGGFYFWSDTSVIADNGGSVISVMGVPSGRWFAVYENDEVNVRRFGAKGNGVDDDTEPVRRLINAFKKPFHQLTGAAVLFPKGVFVLDSINIPSGFTLFSKQIAKYISLTDVRSRIIPKAGAKYVFYFADGCTNSSLKGIYIDGQAPAANLDMIAAVRFTGNCTRLEDNQFNRCAQYAILSSAGNGFISRNGVFGWYGPAPTFTGLNDFRGALHITSMGDHIIDDNEIGAGLPYFTATGHAMLRDSVNRRICAVASVGFGGTSIVRGNIFENGDRCVVWFGGFYTLFKDNRMELSGGVGLTIIGQITEADFTDNRYGDNALAGNNEYHDIEIYPGAAGHVNFNGEIFKRITDASIHGSENRVKYHVINKGSATISFNHCIPDTAYNMHGTNPDKGLLNMTDPASLPVLLSFEQYDPNNPKFTSVSTEKEVADTPSVGYAKLIRGTSVAGGNLSGGLQFLRAGTTPIALMGFNTGNDVNLTFNNSATFRLLYGGFQSYKAGGSIVDLNSLDGLGYNGWSFKSNLTPSHVNNFLIDNTTGIGRWTSDQDILIGQIGTENFKFASSGLTYIPYTPTAGTLSTAGLVGRNTSTGELNIIPSASVAPATGGTGYIQNTPSPAQSGSIRITGGGIMNTLSVGQDAFPAYPLEVDTNAISGTTAAYFKGQIIVSNGTGNTNAINLSQLNAYTFQNASDAGSQSNKLIALTGISSIQSVTALHLGLNTIWSGSPLGGTFAALNITGDVVTHTANTSFAFNTTSLRPAVFNSRVQGLRGTMTNDFITKPQLDSVAGLIPAGTVTSVGLSLPSIFSVSGSPVTTSGTLTGTLATQTANTGFFGPTSGGVATPTFRALVAADIPALSYVSSLNGLTSGTQTFALDQLNTTPTWTSSTSTHTLSLPLMTTGVTSGMLSNTTQTIPGSKTFSNAASFQSSISCTALTATTTAGNQLAGRYDASNAFTVSTGSTGITQITNTGTSATTQFNQRVKLGTTYVGANTDSLLIKGAADGYIKSLHFNQLSLNTSVLTAGTLPVSRGGTGLATLGIALQQLRVNAGATAFEYFTPSSGGNLTPLKDVYTDQGNSSTTPNNYTALHTFNVAANTLTADGQKVLMTSGGVYSATVGTKDLQLFINGYGCGAFLSTSVSDGWHMDVFFIRTGTTTGRVIARVTGGTALSDAIETDLTGLDYTGAITFAVWGASGTGTVNDVTAKLTRWVFEQAAP